ncbi:RING finger and WD repeat domain-containing protein 3 [Coemansia sp. RSA 2399]|nr:RING finger and WD repeat domain-containing protein 3 [Coemansia sp. RSA 2399]KAJ1898126.1 RING finger and WD repeat domain-containing protein 3 [Coemansia sp. IMI 209127]
MDSNGEVLSSPLTDIDILFEPREPHERQYAAAPGMRRQQLDHSCSTMSIDSVESVVTLESNEEAGPGSDRVRASNQQHRGRSAEHTDDDNNAAATVLKRRRTTHDANSSVASLSRHPGGTERAMSERNNLSDGDDNGDDFAKPRQPLPPPQSLVSPAQNSRQQKESAEAAGDERNTCPVCMEAWTIGGATRLVSLRCGHLFCNRCIRRWMRSATQTRKRAKCPECNQPVGKGDVRPIYARSITAVDGEQVQRLQTENKVVAERARNLEAQLNMMETRFNNMRGNSNRLNQALSEATERADWLAAENKALVDEISEIRANGGSCAEPPEYRPTVRLRATHRAAAAAGASMRRLAFDPHTHRVYATYAHHALGIHTLAQVDIHDTHAKPFILPPLHTAEIRAAEPSPHDAAARYMLTASTDRSAVLVSLDAAPNIAARLQLPEPGWSCAWDPVAHSVFYVGAARGQVLAFDLRRPCEPLHVWDGPRHGARLAAASLAPAPIDMSPIGSIAVVTHASGSDDRATRLIVANASHAYALPLPGASGQIGCAVPWVQLTPNAADTGHTHRACYSMTYDHALGCMAASFRTAPSKTQPPALVHDLYSVGFDAHSLAPATWLLRQRLTVDSRQTMWARSSVFSYLDARAARRGLFCAGVEASRSVSAWDASIAESDRQRLLLDLDDARDEGPVLDVRGFQWGASASTDGPASGPTVLASLTQSTIRIYDVR